MPTLRIAAWDQAAADYFGLIDQKPLVPIDDANASHPVGLGRVGRLPKPVALKDFAQRVFDEVSDHGMTSALGIQVCGDSTLLFSMWPFCLALGTPCSTRYVPPVRTCT